MIISVRKGGLPQKHVGMYSEWIRNFLEFCVSIFLDQFYTTRLMLAIQVQVISINNNYKKSILKDQKYTKYICKKCRGKLETIQHTIGASWHRSRKLQSSPQAANIVYQKLAVTCGSSNVAPMVITNTSHTRCYTTPTTVQ
jgi:hypothetical protein